MVDKIDYRALIQPVPSISEEMQAEILARYEPTETYVCRTAEDFENFLKQIRPPRVAVVAYIALLGEQRGNKLDRADNMAGMKAAIHKRGSYVVEGSSWRTSSGSWPKLRRDGEEMCRRLSQGAKSVLNARKGAEPYTWSERDIGIMWRIKESKRYKNDPERIEAIRKHGIKPVPGRTTLLVRIPQLARELGLTD